MRRRPYAVVLFDEIEKAHPEVFNVFLQVLDDGRLTDGQGRVVNFKNTVIIMTSNVASAQIKAMAPQGDYAAQRKAIMRELDNYFRPEFLNRIDEIVIFHNLKAEDMAQIVDIQVDRLRTLLLNRGVQLVLSDAARRFLAERGYDPIFGARPLKRVIQRELSDALAVYLLEGTIREGDTVYADVDNEGTSLVFSPLVAETA